MSYNLFLDDERYPRKVTWVDLPLVEWVIVRNYNQFVNKIKTDGLPDRISFDHDLSYEHYPCSEPDGGIGNPKNIPYQSYKEKTGMDCAIFLVEYCREKKLNIPTYYVHSMNPIGKSNIISYIKSYQRSLE